MTQNMSKADLVVEFDIVLGSQWGIALPAAKMGDVPVAALSVGVVRLEDALIARMAPGNTAVKTTRGYTLLTAEPDHGHADRVHGCTVVDACLQSDVRTAACCRAQTPSGLPTALRSAACIARRSLSHGLPGADNNTAIPHRRSKYHGGTRLGLGRRVIAGFGHRAKPRLGHQLQPASN